MEQNSTSARLHALDGIRGLAIILVILNHVSHLFIGPLLPPWLVQLIFASGFTGVSLLFVLSGFFMAYIYPHPASASSFLQKRYTRIFPLFVTLCAVMLVFRLYPQLEWYFQLLLIFAFSLIFHGIWVHLIKRFASVTLRKLIFISFVILQIGVGLFYLLFVMRHPAILLNQQLPAIVREGTVGLVNATLTLPLGNYIPMLDGVYWSLVAEVLFYVLYPILCVPLIKLLSPKKRYIKILALLSLVPLFLGLDILAHKIWVVSMLQLQICFYFVMGIVLGYLYRNKSLVVESLHKLFSGKKYYMSIVVFLFVVLFKTLSFNYIERIFDPLVHILWAFPVAFVIAIALNQKTAIARLLQTRVFVLLGTISYSMYLTHTPIIHIVERSIKEKDALTNIAGIALVIALTIFISIILYYLLERPYFLRSDVKNVLKKESKSPNFLLSPKLFFPIIVGVYLVAIFSAYQSNFNFFSIMHPLKPLLSNSSSIIPMNSSPHVEFEFTSPDDQLDIVTTNLTYHFKTLSPVDRPKLVFRVKESGAKEWYATNTYDAAEIGRSLYHPLGFPPIQDAKDKKYIVSLDLLNGTPTEYLSLDASKINGVFKVDKTELIKSPRRLFIFIMSRIMTVVSDNDAQLVFLLLLPCLLVFTFVIYSKKSKKALASSSN